MWENLIINLQVSLSVAVVGELFFVILMSMSFSCACCIRGLIWVVDGMADLAFNRKKITTPVLNKNYKITSSLFKKFNTIASASFVSKGGVINFSKI